MTYDNNNIMLKSDEFVLVKKRKHRKHGKIKDINNEGTIEEEVAHLITKIDNCLQEIKRSQFYTDFLDSLGRCLEVLKRPLTSDKRSHDEQEIKDNFSSTWSSKLVGEDVSSSSDKRLISEDEAVAGDFRQVVCYGLGNFSTCLIARYQLALLMALREEIQIDLKSCRLYDPRFTETEKKFIEGAGMTLIDKNEECKRPCRQTTLFFMPHCDKPLYNNLLYSNWTPSIEKIIIIGNSFNSTVHNVSRRVLESEAAYILKIVPYTEEVPIANTFSFTDIFNDTSIHCFPALKLRDAPEDFWESSIEPTYDRNNLGVVFNS